GRPAASAHPALGDVPAARGAAIARLARGALPRAPTGAKLVAAQSPELVPIALAGASHPAGWGHERQGLVMSAPGSLAADLSLPRGGAWTLWLKGQIMPSLGVSIDGRALGSVAGQLDGTALVPATSRARTGRPAAGRH